MEHMRNTLWDTVPMAAAPIDESKLRTLRLALAEGMTASKAAKAAGIGRTTLYRLAKTDLELAALLEAGKPRARANRHRDALTGPTGRKLRTLAEPVSLVTELVADADAIGGPSLAEMMDEGWRLFKDAETDAKLKAALYRELIRVKAAPVIAELARQANAVPVAQGPERVRLVLPAKAPSPDS